jgi:hypothetical protein
VLWVQPPAEPEFIEATVLRSADGELWREDFCAAESQLAEPPCSMPVEVSPTPRGVDVLERGNPWLLNTALALACRRPASSG